MKRKLSGILLALALTFSLLPAAALAAFSDTQGHWAEEAINTWSDMGIIQGYDGRFRPDDPITRGDMAVLLDRLMEYETAADNTYPDLPADAYYTDAVLRARAAGVMLGDGTYMRPLDKITREEAVVMLGRAFEIPESDTVPDYSDYAAISSWARGTVNAMSEAGVVQGYDGAFHPGSDMTRAQVVTFLDNLVFGFFAYVETDDELADALASGVPGIIVMDTIGRTDTYRTYEIDHPVVIMGAVEDTMVYGTFRILSDGVVIDSLKIDPRDGTGPMRSAIDVLAKQVMITNNTFVLNQSEYFAGSDVRGVTVWPYGDAETGYYIDGNTFQLNESGTGFCTAIEVVEGKDLSAFGLAGEVSGKANIPAEDEAALAQGNTYDKDCDYGYARTDWSTGSPVYQFSYVPNSGN